jgi:hypothetical protein
MKFAIFLVACIALLSLSHATPFVAFEDPNVDGPASAEPMMQSDNVASEDTNSEDDVEVATETQEEDDKARNKLQEFANNLKKKAAEKLQAALTKATNKAVDKVKSKLPQRIFTIGEDLEKAKSYLAELKATTKDLDVTNPLYAILGNLADQAKGQAQALDAVMLAAAEAAAKAKAAPVGP